MLSIHFTPGHRTRLFWGLVLISEHCLPVLATMTQGRGGGCEPVGFLTARAVKMARATVPRIHVRIENIPTNTDTLKNLTFEEDRGFHLGICRDATFGLPFHLRIFLPVLVTIRQMSTYLDIWLPVLPQARLEPCTSCQACAACPAKTIRLTSLSTLNYDITWCM